MLAKLCADHGYSMMWLLGYLAGKALAKPEKRLHHIVSSAAVLLNWFRNETGESTAMRPGIAPPVQTESA